MAASSFNQAHLSWVQPELFVPYLPVQTESGTDSLKKVSEVLDLLPRQAIAMQPWPEYSYQPEVKFSLAHAGTSIYLKYYVSEEVVLARFLQTNDPVYKDSCVEFFISFPEDSAYYNLEFNALGTCCAGYGPDRENRQLLDPERLHLIRRDVLLVKPNSNNFAENYHWQITLNIPVTVFNQKAISSLQGITAKGNFYKCGDELPQPHFLTWSPVVAPVPNFHLPTYFGRIQFE